MRTLDSIIQHHFADLMWTICGLEAQLERAQARIKELEETLNDKAQDTVSDG